MQRDPAVAQPVQIQITKDADKIEVDPSDGSISIGDSVTFITNDKKLKSELRFDVAQSGSTLQSLNIHASCSRTRPSPGARDRI